MKKLILASVSAIALFGVAACSDTDNTTTQSIDPDVQTTTPLAPADSMQKTPDASAPATPPTSTPAPAVE